MEITGPLQFIQIFMGKNVSSSCIKRIITQFSLRNNCLKYVTTFALMALILNLIVEFITLTCNVVFTYIIMSYWDSAKVLLGYNCLPILPL